MLGTAYRYASLYSQQVVDPATQDLLPSTSVTVYLTGTNILATLYSSNLKSATVGNPTTTDAYGNLVIWADEGYYDIAASGGNRVTVYIGPDPAGMTDVTFYGPNGTSTLLNGLLAALVAAGGPYRVVISGILSLASTDPPVMLPSGIHLDFDSMSLSGITSAGTQNIVQSANWGNPAACDAYIKVGDGVLTGPGASTPSIPLTFGTLAAQSGLGPTGFTLNVLNTGAGTTSYYGTTPAFTSPRTDASSSWSNASSTVYIPSVTYRDLGAAVTGTGIPTGSFISSINYTTLECTLMTTNSGGTVVTASTTSAGTGATIGGMLQVMGQQVGYSGMTSSSFTGCFVVGYASTKTFSVDPHAGIVPFNSQGSGLALQCMRPTIGDVHTVNTDGHGVALQGNANANAYGAKVGKLRVDAPNCCPLYIGTNATDAYAAMFTSTIVGSSPGWGVWVCSGDWDFSGIHVVNPGNTSAAPGVIVAAGNNSFRHLVLDTVAGPNVVIGRARTPSPSTPTNNRFDSVGWVTSGGNTPTGPLFLHNTPTSSASVGEVINGVSLTGTEPWAYLVQHGAKTTVAAGSNGVLLAAGTPTTLDVANAAVLDQTGDPANVINIVHAGVTYTGTYDNVNIAAGTISVTMNTGESVTVSTNDVVQDPTWGQGTMYTTWGTNHTPTGAFWPQPGDTFTQPGAAADWTGAVTGLPISGYKTEYAPATLDTVTVTGQTLTAVDTVHATLSFPVPASGNAYVRVKGLVNAAVSGNMAILALFLHGTTTQIGLPVVALRTSSTYIDAAFDVEIPILGGALAAAGYAPGSTVQVDLAMCCGTASNNVSLLIQGNTGAASATTGNPLIMTPIAA